MADPTSWILIKAFETCLKRIKVADGFFTDAGNHVVLEPRQAPETDGVLLVPMIESRARATDPAVLRTHRLATVTVIAKLGDVRADAQQRLQELLDDIEQAFENRQADFPKGYQFPTFVDAQPIAPAEGMTWTGAVVRFTSHIPKRQPAA